MVRLRESNSGWMGSLDGMLKDKVQETGIGDPELGAIAGYDSLFVS